MKELPGIIGGQELAVVDQHLGAAVPAEERMDRRAAVRRLAPRIRELQASGYSMEAIAQLLREGGLRIGTNTLRRHWKEAKQTAEENTAVIKTSSAQSTPPALAGLRTFKKPLKSQAAPAAPVTKGSHAGAELTRAEGCVCTEGSDPNAPKRPGHFTVIPDSETL